ncbi:MAG: PAS domain-containing protein [Alphaproteobacteria bacterium]|nr:PAS domain-containing protein [Alphaproteobacteria bacterium]
MDFEGADLPRPLADLFHYWRSKHTGEKVPSRADISPVEMRGFYLIRCFWMSSGTLRTIYVSRCVSPVRISLTHSSMNLPENFSRNWNLAAGRLN